VKASRDILHQIGERHPEEYCYYGVEGNPHFTQRLQALEERMNNATPRLLQRAHFLTETVGAGHDGPTVLYLDTINTKQNFWGSSLLAGHRDVQRSANAKGHGEASQVVQAPVQGITLSSLLQQAVLKQAGAHVLIKMDIEGGEYYVLEEAFQSGELCAYAQSGVQIHLIVETHRPDVIGMTNIDLQHWRHLKRSLQDCGVILQTGRDAG
jgi:hypothetical protein